ncbi:formamidase, partial [Sarracenia purpurea var. burkii]
TIVFGPSMAPPTPRLVIPIDLKKKPWEQKFPLHNRWHPDIPPASEVKTGEVIRVEMVDWTGGNIKDDDSATDIKFIDLSNVSINRTTSIYYISRHHLITFL